MEKSHISTERFELEVDDRSEYSEKCLAAAIVLLKEMRDGLWTIADHLEFIARCVDKP